MLERFTVKGEEVSKIVEMFSLISIFLLRRRDSTGAVYSRSLMFFSCLNSCALVAAYYDFPLKIVGNATFVAT
jgi:hypothetical protein